MNNTLGLILELSPEQKRKFNLLKKSYKECLKAGIRFENVYGCLYALPADIVMGYGDEHIKPDGELLIKLNGCIDSSYYFRIPQEWADDNHIMGLSKKGKDLYEKLE